MKRTRDGNNGLGILRLEICREGVNGENVKRGADVRGDDHVIGIVVEIEVAAPNPLTSLPTLTSLPLPPQFPLHISLTFNPSHFLLVWLRRSLLEKKAKRKSEKVEEEGDFSCTILRKRLRLFCSEGSDGNDPKRIMFRQFHCYT
ncbi:hypothetical protein C1H46_037679 [Malus baccata]|uniref:Uncharacterized protein n=1 Tax=Malus baccata TaxID=106549 RepID=A0A540KRI8_MALBA|nr:hypothetical protein C1H46_037679 [Malus baccata]